VSLVGFHRSLIVTAIAFCFVYAGWETRAWLATGQSGVPMLAAAFGLLGLGLIVYLTRLRAILKLED
jgi:hydrogenase-4 membrane subunit HyfE